MLRFEGAGSFRSRVVGSILSSRPIVIHKIRELDDAPGVSGYEVSFLELVDKLTNGTAVSINATGTVVSITQPGFVVGGQVEHACDGRAIGYFLEGVIPLCLLAKQPVALTLTGVTNDDVDLSVDVIKIVTMRILSRFGAADPYPGVEIVSRGLAPNGKGKVVFTCPVLKELKAVQLMDAGFVRKVRGLAYGVRVSPQITNRMATSARGVFNELLPDVYVNTDHFKGKEVDSGPGYGLMVYCESTTGCYYGAARAAVRQSVTDVGENNKVGRELTMMRQAHPGVDPVSDPETLATKVSQQLLEEVERSGCIDSSHQPLLFFLMAICPEDVSKVRIGRLTNRAIAVLRIIQETLSVTFKLKVDESDGTVICSCVGAGLRNMAKRVS